MRFLAQHDVDGEHYQEQLFDTTSVTFIHDFGTFCNRTGRTAKDVLTFKIAQETAKTRKKFNEVTVSAEIHLCVFFGNLYDVENFFGHCNAKVVYKMEPADPGLYMKEFANLDITIANLIIAKYQNLSLLDI